MNQRRLFSHLTLVFHLVVPGLKFDGGESRYRTRRKRPAYNENNARAKRLTRKRRAIARARSRARKAGRP